MIDFSNYFEIASEINTTVADYLKSKFGPLKVASHKSDSHYGIKEDLESNSMYEDFLRKKTPEVALYTEEGERNLDSELVWVIDPIEGTSNFRSGNPFWGTQIALLYRNEPVIGIVNVPMLNQEFTAIKNMGSFMNKNKIYVSPLTNISEALIDMVRGTKDTDKDWAVETLAKVIKRVRTNRVFGACGVDMSYCASGMTDLFISKGAYPYDYAAGSIIAKEAGALVTDLGGNKWTIENDEIVCGNSKLVKDLLKILHE